MRPCGSCNRSRSKNLIFPAEPTRRQKSSRFVQQPSVTCWQLSTCSPSGNTYDVARPPRNGRCSNRRTRQPASASATPADSPPSPPPITITFCKDVLFRVAPKSRLRHPPYLPPLPPPHPPSTH